MTRWAPVSARGERAVLKIIHAVLVGASGWSGGIVSAFERR
ncbi:MAG TPA: hypothetical protein VGQ10_03845 [Vicinamibacterales bacterium]|nr:hypothetical protein [Vicinamibacterales bacterium]